ADGSSATLLVGEKRLNRSRLGQNQQDDGEGYTAGWDEDTVRWTGQPPLPDVLTGGESGDGRFGSSHVAGFYAVFADGSMRPIKYTIDPTVFAKLGSIADGQVINLNDF